MININHPSRSSQSLPDLLPRFQSLNNRRCMTAFLELAQYLADSAQHELDIPLSYQFRCAFLDDDSDYIPAAIDMMNALTAALTADYTELECDILLARIATDRPISDALPFRISDISLDAPNSLPIPEYDYEFN